MKLRNFPRACLTGALLVLGTTGGLVTPSPAAHAQSVSRADITGRWGSEQGHRRRVLRADKRFSLTLAFRDPNTLTFDGAYFHRPNRGRTREE